MSFSVCVCVDGWMGDGMDQCDGLTLSLVKRRFPLLMSHRELVCVGSLYRLTLNRTQPGHSSRGDMRHTWQLPRIDGRSAHQQ